MQNQWVTVRHRLSHRGNSHDARTRACIHIWPSGPSVYKRLKYIAIFQMAKVRKVGHLTGPLSPQMANFSHLGHLRFGVENQYVMTRWSDGQRWEYARARRWSSKDKERCNADDSSGFTVTHSRPHR